jgi:hypothetical protein
VAHGLTSVSLHATFTGALSFLGTVALNWNGASWVGTSSCGGGAILALLCLGPVFQLVSAGPGPVFSVGGAPTSYHPFTWSATGLALGGCAGQFQVHVTE